MTCRGNGWEGGIGADVRHLRMRRPPRGRLIRNSGPRVRKSGGRLVEGEASSWAHGGWGGRWELWVRAGRRQGLTGGLIEQFLTSSLRSSDFGRPQAQARNRRKVQGHLETG